MVYVGVHLDWPGEDQAVFDAASTWDGGGSSNAIVIQGTDNQFFGPAPVFAGFDSVT